jgi:hypothetical protein
VVLEFYIEYIFNNKRRELEATEEEEDISLSTQLSRDASSSSSARANPYYKLHFNS